MQINLEELLKVSYQRELERMPEQHSQRTPDCPTIGYYPKYAREGWPEELKAHATKCAYCQMLLASAWNVIGNHPSEEQINDPNYENKLAVERHLNGHGCEPCAEKIEKK